MRLLLCCPHFDPDVNAATGVVMTRLVESLAELGHEATVVTSLPWYKGHKVADGWGGRLWRTERTDWGKIVRVYPFPTSKTNIAARAFGFAGFTTLVTSHSIFRGGFDVVMGMSPPIFLGEAAYLAAKRNRAPLVFNVQDIFPDVAVELGALSNKRVISAASRYERSLYRRSDAVTVLSEDQAANVRSKIDGTGDKVHIIPNFVDTQGIEVVERDNSFRRQLGVKPDQKLVMYSGNVGLSQSFDLIRAAAKQYSDRRDVVFCINGEGAARPQVNEWAASLDNVIVRDFAPREQLSNVLGAADLHLILLKRQLAKSSTPSKLYSILSAGRPILASIDVPSEVSQAIEQADCGLAVEPESESEFLAGLDKLLQLSQADLAELGRNGRSYASQPSRCTTALDQARRYESLFKDLIDARRRD